MGPPLFSGGNGPGPNPEPPTPPPASMGPPLFSGGNGYMPSLLQCGTYGLQWGRRCSAAEIMAASSSDSSSEHRASMGPPLFSGGNPGGGQIVRKLYCASMGPPLFSGGNLRNKRRTIPAGCRLQWGRCSAAEMSTGWQAPSWSASAFNGAAAVQRRKFPPACRRTWPTHPLQWGRRCSAAEITEMLAKCPPGPRLQWGRRCSAAEMAAPGSTRPSWRRCLQWGRRCSAAEMGASEIRAGQAFVPSMGPPLFSGGNWQPAGRAARRAAMPSMGPPLFSGGNSIYCRRPPRPCPSFNGAAAVQRRK